jgi:hypothetical protein
MWGKGTLVHFWWLTSVILGTWEVEIRMITIQGQLKQIDRETPFPK